MNNVITTIMISIITSSIISLPYTVLLNKEKYKECAIFLTLVFIVLIILIGCML